MISGIHNVYRIMWQQFDVIESVYDNINDENISQIIAEYLWIKLPSYDGGVIRETAVANNK